MYLYLSIEPDLTKDLLQIQISCVRILGSMLRLMSKVFKADDGAFEEVLGILSEALDSPIAKVCIRRRVLQVTRSDQLLALRSDGILARHSLPLSLTFRPQ